MKSEQFVRFVSKVALAVYNHMTDNKWVEYQQNYQSEMDK